MIHNKIIKIKIYKINNNIKNLMIVLIYYNFQNYPMNVINQIHFIMIHKIELFGKQILLELIVKKH